MRVLCSLLLFLAALDHILALSGYFKADVNDAKNVDGRIFGECAKLCMTNCSCTRISIINASCVMGGDEEVTTFHLKASFVH